MGEGCVLGVQKHKLSVQSMAICVPPPCVPDADLRWISVERSPFSRPRQCISAQRSTVCVGFPANGSWSVAAHGPGGVLRSAAGAIADSTIAITITSSPCLPPTEDRGMHFRRTVHVLCSAALPAAFSAQRSTFCAPPHSRPKWTQIASTSMPYAFTPRYQRASSPFTHIIGIISIPSCCRVDIIMRSG